MYKYSVLLLIKYPFKPNTLYGIRACISRHLIFQKVFLFFISYLSTMSETSLSPASTNETIIVSTTPTLLNVNMTNVTKLTSTNFLMWLRQ